MKKIAFLGFGAFAFLAMAVPASAVLLEGHFSGRADHSGGVPGNYLAGETYNIYMTLNTVQPNPWYPWNAGSEYTAVVSTSVSAYNAGVFPKQLDLADASVSIYEDAGTAADYANVATFTDGTLVLSGTITNYLGQESLFGGLNVNGNLVLSGGAGIGSLSAQCSGGMVLNDFINYFFPPGSWPDAQGYEEAYDAKWECPDVTGTDPTTWGRVKGSYR